MLLWVLTHASICLQEIVLCRSVQGGSNMYVQIDRTTKIITWTFQENGNQTEKKWERGRETAHLLAFRDKTRSSSVCQELMSGSALHRRTRYGHT